MNALKPYTSMKITTDKLDDTIKADMFTQHVVVEGFEAVVEPTGTPLTNLAKIYERETVLKTELLALEGNHGTNKNDGVEGINSTSGVAAFIKDTYGCASGNFNKTNWVNESNECQLWASDLAIFHSNVNWADNRTTSLLSLVKGTTEYNDNEIEFLEKIGKAERAIDVLYTREKAAVDLSGNVIDPEELSTLRSEYVQLIKDKRTYTIEGLTVIENIAYPIEASIVDSYKKAKADVIVEQRDYLKALVNLMFAHTERRLVEYNNYGSEGDRNRERNEKDNTLTNKTNDYNNALTKRDDKQVILETVEATMGHAIAPTPTETGLVRTKETEIFNLINEYLRLSSDYLVLLQGGIYSSITDQKRNAFTSLTKTIKNAIDDHKRLRDDELNAQANILNGTTTIDTTGYASMSLDELNAEALKWANEIRLLENALSKANDQMTYGNTTQAINIHPLSDDNGKIIAQEDTIDISRNTAYADYEATVDTIQQKLTEARGKYFTVLTARNTEYVTARDNITTMKANYSARLNAVESVEEVNVIVAEINAEKVTVNNINLGDYTADLQASQNTLFNTIQTEADPVLKAQYQRTYDISGIMLDELNEMNSAEYAYETIHPDSIATMTELATKIYEIEKGAVNDELRVIFEAYLIAKEKAKETENANDIDLSNNALIAYNDAKNSYIIEIETLYNELELANKINYIETEKNTMLDGLITYSNTIITAIDDGSWVSANTTISDDEGRELDVSILGYYDHINDEIAKLQKQLSNATTEGERSRINSDLSTQYTKQVDYIYLVRKNIKGKITEYENAKAGKNSREKGIYEDLIAYYEGLLPLIDYLGVESNIGGWLITTYGRPILIDLGMALFNTPAFDDLVFSLDDSGNIKPYNVTDNEQAIKDRLSKLITIFLYNDHKTFFDKLEEMINTHSTTINPLEETTKGTSGGTSGGTTKGTSGGTTSEVIQYGTVDIGAVDVSGSGI
jgi:hypothetical protein